MVKKGEITSIDEIFQQSLKISEEQIVDTLISNLEDEVININLVQRQTDAGEKSRFKACVGVGNRNGFVGIGEAKTKEIEKQEFQEKLQMAKEREEVDNLKKMIKEDAIKCARELGIRIPKKGK